jgi:hypothetical protein
MPSKMRTKVFISENRADFPSLVYAYVWRLYIGGEKMTRKNKTGLNGQDSDQNESIIFDKTFYREKSGFMIYTKIVIQKLPKDLTALTEVRAEDIENYFTVKGTIVAEAINKYLLTSSPSKQKSSQLPSNP